MTFLADVDHSITHYTQQVDRPPPGVDPVYHLREAPQEGFLPACQNILPAGRSLVEDVVANWDLYESGVAPSNYLGDIFGSLSSLYGPANFGTLAKGDILGR